MFLTISIHCIYTRITHIMNRVLMSGKKLNLKRQDGKQFVHIPLDIFNPILFPSPYFRRNIIVDRYFRLLLYKLGYFQVKAGIIHQNHYIRSPTNNVLLTFFHIPKDSTQMQQHRDKTHISQFFVMLHPRSTNSRHQVSAKETEFCFRIFLYQGTHQIRCVQIA